MLARNAKIDADDVGVAPPDTRFPTTAARIDVLRKAVRNLLSCSLPKGDSENALLMRCVRLSSAPALLS